MGNELPELTPERIREIWILLAIAAALIALVWSPFILNWWLERQIRIMRSAHQYHCPYCRKGTDWNEARNQCLNCGNQIVTSPPENIDGTQNPRSADARIGSGCNIQNDRRELAQGAHRGSDQAPDHAATQAQQLGSRQPVAAPASVP